MTEIKIIPLNNTEILVKKEWKARHQCIGDVMERFTQEDIEEGKPIKCLLCGKEIVKFESK